MVSVDYSPNLNILTANNYEEGTWTPTAVYSSSAATAVSHVIQQGDYIKIGKMVVIQCFLRWTESAASGDLTIEGMPFAHSTTVRDDTYSSYYASAITGLTDGGILAYNQANIMRAGFANAGAWAKVTQANTGTNSTLNFVHTYFTD